jgi:hypothetical protein
VKFRLVGGTTQIASKLCLKDVTTRLCIFLERRVIVQSENESAMCKERQFLTEIVKTATIAVKFFQDRCSKVTFAAKVVDSTILHQPNPLQLLVPHQPLHPRRNPSPRSHSHHPTIAQSASAVATSAVHRSSLTPTSN